MLDWQALDAIPRDRAEWLCWIDMDIVLADPTFTFPLDKVNYTDRDIIIWGGKKQILAGDAEYGGLPLPWVEPVSWAGRSRFSRYCLSSVRLPLEAPHVEQCMLASVPAGRLGRQHTGEVQLLAGTMWASLDAPQQTMQVAATCSPQTVRVVLRESTNGVWWTGSPLSGRASCLVKFVGQTPCCVRFRRPVSLTDWTDVDVLSLCRAEHGGHAGAQHRLVPTPAGHDRALRPVPAQHDH